MYKLIKDIAECCYTTAKNRGKDVSCVGCLQGLRTELAEYWSAVDSDKQIVKPVDTIKTALLLAKNDLAAYYDKHIHNTDTDELADVLIVAATWMHAAKIAGGEDFDPDRSIDVMLAGGAIQFVCGRISEPAYLRR
ncbi:MAG: hypothetical protein RSD70_03075, partial [Acidaminococcaceae bacterium]